MKPGGHGKAKVLTDAQMDRLFDEGLKSPRDKAFFATLRYTGARPREGQLLHYADAFDGETIRPKILIRKKHTKGQQSTRVMKIHSNLARYLAEYRQHALKALQIKQEYGNWSALGFRSSLLHVECPRCKTLETSRDGLACYSLIKQKYECRKCNYHFTSREPMTSFDSKNRYINTEKFIELGIGTSACYGFLFLNKKNPYLFPGIQGESYLCYQTFRDAFEKACDRVEIVGASMYSFRRTFLTRLHNSGHSLRVIQDLSGHRSLGALQRYLEVSDEQIAAAIYSLPY